MQGSVLTKGTFLGDEEHYLPCSLVETQVLYFWLVGCLLGLRFDPEDGRSIPPRRQRTSIALDGVTPEQTQQWCCYSQL
jgi:hypothetical protein